MKKSFFNLAAITLCCSCLFMETIAAQQIYSEDGFELLYTWRETELCVESEFTPIARLDKRELMRGYGFEPLLRFDGQLVLTGRGRDVLCRFDDMQIFKGRSLEVLYTLRENELCEGLGFYPAYRSETEGLSMEQWVSLLFVDGAFDNIRR